MSVDWNRVARDHWDAQPHPQASPLPDGRVLTVKEYRMAVQLASAMKFGGHASPAEASAFWMEYEPLLKKGVTPEDFLQALDVAAPISFALHGQPPAMSDLARFWDEKASRLVTPDQIATYYKNLPDRDYPHVSAGDMVKSVQAATPYARQHLGREPTKGEAAFFVHAGMGPQAVSTHYQGLADQHQQTQAAQEWDGRWPTP